MNAIIALCHFCEIHGPRILFCTQPFHCSNHSPNDILKGVAPSPTACGISYKRNNSTEKESATTPTPERQNETASSSSSKPSTCESCQSLQQGDPGFISIDKESHISYISMQYPEEPELFAVLRHACVRSLSCEVCPGREGPIMFGDEASGYVFSHTFSLKDLQSRGFQRWYSVICVMMDRIYLVNSWQFLISNFKNVIDELQARALKVYKEEEAAKPHKEMLLQPRNNLFNLEQFRRVRGGQVYRSLADITKDQEIFQYLHKTFGWILKASGERYTEKVLVGPPVEEYLLDENNVSQVEGSKEIEELLSDGTQHGPIFESLMHMYKVLGSSNFLKLAYHVVRGDQLIVRGKNKRTVASLLETAKLLVPGGCVQGCRYHDTEYWDSFRCNFLGLKENIEVPPYVLHSELVVFINITLDVNAQEEITIKSHFSSLDNSFDGIVFEVIGSPVDKEPTYLKQLMQSLKDETINDNIFKLILVTLKEQWMGKVKVMFKFSKTSQRTKEDKLKLLNILNATVDDEILLKYWMTTLSQSYRAHLLETSHDSKES